MNTILEYDFKQSRGVRDSLHKLIHLKSGMLKELIIGDGYGDEVRDEIVRLVSSPSSLQHLAIAYSRLANFNTSNNLSELTITNKIRKSLVRGDDWSKLVPDIVRILKENQTCV